MASTGRSDPYQVLGVGQTAPATEITRVYKKLALKHHPDKNPDNREQAEKEFQAIAEAYQIVGDLAKRQEYDRKYASRPAMRTMQPEVPSNMHGGMQGFGMPMMNPMGMGMPMANGMPMMNPMGMGCGMQMGNRMNMMMGGMMGNGINMMMGGMNPMMMRSGMGGAKSTDPIGKGDRAQPDAHADSPAKTPKVAKKSSAPGPPAPAAKASSGSKKKSSPDDESEEHRQAPPRGSDEPLDPRLEDLCTSFGIEYQVAKRLEAALLRREATFHISPATFEDDLAELRDGCKNTSKPTRYLASKAEEIERGVFATGELGWKFKYVQKEFRLSTEAQRSFIKFFQPRDLGAEADNLWLLLDHLRASPDPSWTMKWLLDHVGVDGDLPDAAPKPPRRRSPSRSRSRGKARAPRDQGPRLKPKARKQTRPKSNVADMSNAASRPAMWALLEVNWGDVSALSDVSDYDPEEFQHLRSKLPEQGKPKQEATTDASGIMQQEIDDLDLPEEELELSPPRDASGSHQVELDMDEL